MVLSDIKLIQEELKDYSPYSKIWVYYSEKSFLDHNKEIKTALDQFTKNWKSHGSPVRGKCFTLGGHILMIIADTSVCEVSGCSTDSSVQFIAKLGSQFQHDFFDRQLVMLCEDNKIITAKLEQLEQYSPDTLVFNPFFSDLANWRDSFIQKLGESKYKRYVKSYT